MGQLVWREELQGKVKQVFIPIINKLVSRMDRCLLSADLRYPSNVLHHFAGRRVLQGGGDDIGYEVVTTG
jgi:hypothetical protein